jgi:hypothetical protein
MIVVCKGAKKEEVKIEYLQADKRSSFYRLPLNSVPHLPHLLLHLGHISSSLTGSSSISSCLILIDG